MLEVFGRAVAMLLAGWALVGLVACGGAPSRTIGDGTSTSTASNPAPAVTDEAAVLKRTYADLPQSKTPEGYYALGQPDAPVVMQHYSHFL